MKQTIEKCPKTFEAYKKYLIRINPTSELKLNDEVIILSITSFPIVLTRFFDELGLIGTYLYSPEDNAFDLYLNGELLDAHEDYQWAKEREEAEEKLIKFLFYEAEKTL